MVWNKKVWSSVSSVPSHHHPLPPPFLFPCVSRKIGAFGEAVVFWIETTICLLIWQSMSNLTHTIHIQCFSQKHTVAWRPVTRRSMNFSLNDWNGEHFRIPDIIWGGGGWWSQSLVSFVRLSVMQNEGCVEKLLGEKCSQRSPVYPKYSPDVSPQITPTLI